MNISINKINIISTLELTTINDTCAICREHIEEACITCLSNKKELTCNYTIGACNHVFHKCCITEWVSKMKNCPLCKKLWENK